MNKKILVFALFVLVFNPVDLSAQTSLKYEKFGVGMQVCYPVWGASVIVNLNDDFSIQGILGVIGNFKSFGGRVRYHFSTSEDLRTYSYGLAGAFNYSSSYTNESETIFGYGAGLGIEFTKSRFIGGNPLWFNMEVGYGNLDFDSNIFSFQAIMVGAGVHFYFGE